MLDLESVPTRISNPQKLCDSTDWYDQRLNHIIRQHLRAQPAPRRRQWEFAMIFLALAREGKLRADAKGLGLGVGTERLIFSLAEVVGHVVATDLYGQNSKWVGVRTADPKSHVLQHAPFAIDPDRLDVHAMDMREISYPNDSFDFAWSTGSFEHIGGDSDFVRHLHEVHRTLKPGGVYAFTTAITFSDDSIRIPGNHYFSPEHLLDLVDQSPLHAEPEFDASLVPTRLNQPFTDRPQDLGLGAAKAWLPLVIILHRGIVSAANLVLLHKDDARTKERARLVGWDQARRFVDRSVKMLMDKLWVDWQCVSTEAVHEDANGNRAVGCRTQPQFIGQATAEASVLLNVRSASIARCTVDVTVVERRKGWPPTTQVIAAQEITIRRWIHDAWYDVQLAFEANDDSCYYVEALTGRGAAEFRRSLVWLRRSKSTQ